MKSLYYVLTLVFLSLLTSLYGQEQLVNRRVMLVNFTNLQNKADFEYLEISIPEAMLIALDDTKNFDLLQVSTWDKLIENGKYTKSDTKKDARVQAAGLSQGADVVVLGSFANIGQDLKITARAIEVRSGRLIVTKSVLAKTDGSMFGSIDNLSVDIAREMKKKLPPLPPREVIREKVIGKESMTVSTIVPARLIISKSFYNYNSVSNKGPSLIPDDAYISLAFPFSSSGNFFKISYFKHSLYFDEATFDIGKTINYGVDFHIAGRKKRGRGIYLGFGLSFTETGLSATETPTFGAWVSLSLKIKRPSWYFGLNIEPTYSYLRVNDTFVGGTNLLMGLDFSLAWNR